MTEQPPQYPPPPPGGYGYQPPPPPSPGGYGYPPPAPSPYGAYPQPVGTNGLAIASLVCSLVGLFCGIGPIVGLVLGIIALNQIKKTGQDGRGMALAGVIISGISIALIVIWFIFIGIMAATSHDTTSMMLTTVDLQAFSRGAVV